MEPSKILVPIGILTKRAGVSQCVKEKNIFSFDIDGKDLLRTFKEITPEERKQFEAPEKDGTISKGGVIVIGRIVPRQNSAGPYITESDLQQIEAAVKKINEMIGRENFNLHLHVVSLIHLESPQREFLEGMPVASETTHA